MKTSTHNNCFNQQPYDRFFDFISLKANRYKILLECIEALNLNSSVININQNRHIFIFPKGQKNIRASMGVFPFSGMSPYMLIAHYDRVPGSPGANDNSIAVFHLLNAETIFDKLGKDNWIILFTDKEELLEGETIKEQGSYTLAQKLIGWGLEKIKIFNFDTCGCGNVFILSTTTDYLLKDSQSPNICKVRENIAWLRSRALEKANLLRLDRVLLAPVPFCDDAGFLHSGIAAQTITMLPEEEASKYEALLYDRPKFAELIISGKTKEPKEQKHLPETWRILNKPEDTHLRLTPQYFESVVNFAVELCL